MKIEVLNMLINRKEDPIELPIISLCNYVGVNINEWDNRKF